MGEQLSFVPLDAVKVGKPAFTPTIDVNSGYPHANVSRVLELSNDFFASHAGRDHVREDSRRIADAMYTVDGFAGSFATGFPFFLASEKGFRPVPEISRFLGQTQTIIDADAASHGHGWHCPDCQSRNNLPDLKTLCKPCDIVTLKPRDVFKAVPDIDVFVVADDTSASTRRQIEDSLRASGRSQSDTDIAGTIDRATTVFEAIRRQEVPPTTLPVDIHLLDRGTFQSAMDRMVEGDLNVELDMQSLHMTWEPDKIPFGYDFILQFTPLSFKDQLLLDGIHTTRRELKNRFGEQSLIGAVESYPRGARLLSDAKTKNNLQQRLASW
jgi:hypothetical protein